VTDEPGPAILDRYPLEIPAGFNGRRALNNPRMYTGNEPTHERVFVGLLFQKVPGEASPRLDLIRQRIEVGDGIPVEAVVGDDETCRLPGPESGEACMPGAHVNVRRRHRRQHVEAVAKTDASGVARQHDSRAAIAEAEVVIRVPSCANGIEHRAPKRQHVAVGDDAEVPGRHRLELPPESLHPIAVDLGGARHELRGVAEVRRTPLGLVLFTGIGVLAGMFGLGAGWANVPVLNLVMGAPLKVSAGTSSFILSLVDSSAAWVYLNQGAVLAIVAVPSVAGMMLGARIGARLLTVLKASVVRRLVLALLFAAGLRALLKGLGIWT